MNNRIRELRKERALTMKQLGEVIGVAESTVSQYETGKRNPDSTTLLKLSNFFGVSVGYILGNEEGVFSEDIRKRIGEKILSACGGSFQNVLKSLSSLYISVETVSDMVSGKYPFTPYTLLQIAEQLKKPIEFFLVDKKTPTPQGERQELSPAFFRLKQGLEPYDISDSDVDFLLDVYKAHIKKNSQE